MVGDIKTESMGDMIPESPGDFTGIRNTERTEIASAAFVGDSLPKDILMANRAEIFSIWAAYGAEHDQSLYHDLVRISHWTPEEVIRERQLKEEAKSVQPDYVAHRSFCEVITALEI